jgi:phosphopantothenoylcysteine decarboxylase/phosphopantothenate--cysteine ligase
LPANDIIIKAAAVGDYKIKDFKTQKIKDERPILELVKNPDIAFEVGKIKGGKKLIIFCAETENLKANAIKKLKAKNADLVVANDVTKEGAGFGCDTNIALIIDKKGEVLETNVISKSTLSNIVLDKILKL